MVKCNKCGKIIKKSDDINILAFLGVKPTPFCNSCYAKRERGIKRHFLYFPHLPVNSPLYTVGLIFFTLFFGAMLISILLGFVEGQPSNLLRIIGGIAVSGFLILIWSIWIISRRMVKSLS